MTPEERAAVLMSERFRDPAEGLRIVAASIRQAEEDAVANVEAKLALANERLRTIASLTGESERPDYDQARDHVRKTSSDYSRIVDDLMQSEWEKRMSRRM